MRKRILDCTCGARGIWFDKENPMTLYTDCRKEDYHGTFGKKQGHIDMVIDPDMVVDFTKMPFGDNTFRLVVFDPPHIQGLQDNSWLRKEYGSLDKNWRQVIHDGFYECMRVLEPYGILVFKWSEVQIPASELWKAIGQKPLFGHHSGKKMNTFWGIFMKGNEVK